MDSGSYSSVTYRLGSVEPGKLADLVLMEGNPLNDIQAMKNVRRVILNGVWQNQQPVDKGDSPFATNRLLPEMQMVVEGLSPLSTYS